jgi:hypothetical protein
MARRFSVWILLGIGGLLAGVCLSARAPTPRLSDLAYAESPLAQTSPRIDQVEKDLAALRRAGVLLGLSRLHGDLSNPKPEEIEALRALAEARLATWRQVSARFKAGRVGASSGDEARARLGLSLALARLAWEEQQDKVALAHLQQAVRTADRLVEATQAGYEMGVVTLEAVMEAQAARAETTLLFLRAGGTLPGPRTERAKPWTLPPGEMPEPYPAAGREPRPSDSPPSNR